MTEQLNSSFIKSLIENDTEIISLANKYRLELDEKPYQSEFRVMAILIVESTPGQLLLVTGSNAEQGYIGGAICAERAALCKLRFIPNVKLRHVAVVTDSENPLSPGALCREFLMSHADSDVSVVMGNQDGKKITRCFLHEVWPYPYLYRFQRRQNLISFAQHFATKAETIDSLFEKTYAVQVYQAAISCNKNDKEDVIHPLRLSASVLFDDETIQTAWQLKGLEYGCTLDPVSQLISDMERKKLNLSNENSQCHPKMLVMVDQYGIAHAPFAQARSLLSEHGYGFIEVLVHDIQGKLRVVMLEQLIPQPPGSKLLSHDDF